MCAVVGVEREREIRRYVWDAVPFPREVKDSARGRGSPLLVPYICPTM